MNGFQTKAPSAKQIDEACRAGWFVYIGNRQRVLGAVAHRKGEVTLQGRVWVNKASDLSWEYVPAGDVTITTETFGDRKDNHMAAGKRAAGRPSHVQVNKSKKTGEPDEKRKAQAVVSRSGPAKQGDLPGVEVSKRKIQEIEDLAEIWEVKKKEKEDAHAAFLDADENLVVSMRKHNRTSYSRQTFGKVTVPDPKIHAKFKREKTKAPKPQK